MRPTASFEQRALLGVSIVGVLVLAGVWALVTADPHPAIDQAAFDALRVGPYGRIGRNAPAIANLISGAAAAFTVVALVMAGRQRRWMIAGALILGYALADGVGDVIKIIVARDRPRFELIAANGHSFPSTDSAISVGFVMVAAVLASGFASRRARALLIGLGVLFSAVTGLLTVVFRDHYLTDALAGWALGAAVFAACSGVALRIEDRPRSRTV